MLDSQHIEVLRQREYKGIALTEAEREELDKFYKTLEDEEAVYLKPATERLRLEGLALDEKIRQLAALRDERKYVYYQLKNLTRQIQEIEAQENILLASSKA